MRAILQRVSEASVVVEGNLVGEIGVGLLVLLGINKTDSEREAFILADKIAGLRIFEDDNDKMNLSLMQIGGSALVVSNFTLYADTKKGRRPSFNNAADFELGNKLYEQFCKELTKLDIKVERGIYGEMMKVKLINEGPVTVIVDVDSD